MLTPNEASDVLKRVLAKTPEERDEIKARVEAETPGIGVFGAVVAKATARAVKEGIFTSPLQAIQFLELASTAWVEYHLPEATIE